MGLVSSRKWIVTALALMALLSVASVWRQANAQTQKARAAASAAKDDGFHRPEPKHPLTPQIPSANRGRTDIVFLERSDSLFRPAWATEEMQIVKGNVRFRQAGMWMFCDSAYYYPEKNSLDAFGHVRMEQGDTLFVFSDQLYYDGYARFAKLRCGPSQRTVKMENRDVTLTTDSLDYDMAEDVGWYSEGGQLEDSRNILTSIYGNYSPASKNAEFFHDVLLRSKDDKFRLISDTLYYNTDTKLARIETFTEIQGENDTIYTRKGLYNTDTGVAELLSRSMIMHRDSLNRVTTLEGDSIVYDPDTRITRAYSYRDPQKLATPMVINDTARKARLIGGFGIYNDSTREAMATEYPLMIDYSRPDTLFLRADTIQTWMEVRRVPVRPEDLRREMSDSLTVQPSPADSPVPAAGQLTDSLSLFSERFAQIADTLTFGEIPDLAGLDVPEVIPDSLSGGIPEFVPDSISREFHVARAFPRARFFRSDLQGVSDTITYTEMDSLLRLTRLPIVWSDARQVKGDTIIVHFNDSTADWARLPHKGFMMEHVDEDFYNQLSADRMIVYFEEGDLRELDAEGSVMTIFLPMEQDSTYSRLVYAESSYLTIEMLDGDIDRLKMWPEVTGNVTPVFKVKKNQKLLPKAEWLEALRPKREWLGGGWKWADDLGEIPEELEKYFSTGTAPANTNSNKPTNERRHKAAAGLGGESDSGGGSDSTPLLRD